MSGDFSEWILGALKKIKSLSPLDISLSLYHRKKLQSNKKGKRGLSSFITP
jgi:hypothetical protein